MCFLPFQNNKGGCLKNQIKNLQNAAIISLVSKIEPILQWFVCGASCHLRPKQFERTGCDPSRSTSPRKEMTGKRPRSDIGKKHIRELTNYHISSWEVWKNHLQSSFFRDFQLVPRRVVVMNEPAWRMAFLWMFPSRYDPHDHDTSQRRQAQP